MWNKLLYCTLYVVLGVGRHGMVLLPCNFLYDTCNTKKVLDFKTCFKTLRHSWPKKCPERVVRRLHATKPYRVNQPQEITFFKCIVCLFLQQCNDVMLMCYLSTITKGANSLNEVSTTLTREFWSFPPSFFFFSLVQARVTFICIYSF